MLTENDDLSDDISEDRTHNPCRRRRSSSLGSKRGRDHVPKVKDEKKNIQKYASSNNLWDNMNKTTPDSDTSQYSPRLLRRLTSDYVPLENLFVSWFKDSKSVKTTLSRLHENNIFKTGIPIADNFNYEEFYPPVIFLISNTMKVDNDYEIYTINNYDVRISEFMSWSVENKKELYEEYHKGLKAINQKVVDIATTDYDEEENKKVSDEGTKKNRRHSEIMGLMVINKNQPISTFLPNRILTSFEVVNKVGDVIVTEQARRADKSSRHIIMSNEVISIFATKKMERLKYKFFLKHLYCGTCSDHQIPNIDSSLRIGGPFGDDLIITFSNPNSRNEWYNAIQSSISTFVETFKTQITDITIWKNLELNSSAPLLSKTFSVNGKTTGLELKKKAIEGFNQSDKHIADFILTFNLTGTNREYILNDDVMVMVLQEHIGCFGDHNSCTESCINVGNTILLNRTHFYLKYTPPKEISKLKKPKPNLEVRSTKPKQYSIRDRWIDNAIPEWLMTLLADIYHEGSQVEGIFRLSGVKSKSDDLIQMICDNCDGIDIKEEIHTKANTLKKFLSSIEGSIFTYANKDKLIALSNEITSYEEFIKSPDQINKILSIVESLPQSNLNFLQMFLVVIAHINKNEVVNKMNIGNLSVCLGPTILTEMNEASMDDYMKTKTLLECIFSLIDKIVDSGTQKRIVASFDERKPSMESSSIPTSADENSSNTTVDVTSTNSDVMSKSTTNKLPEPSVPPRRKRRDIIKPNNILLKNDKPDKVRLQTFHKSISTELAVDEVDSTIGTIESKIEKFNIPVHDINRTRPLRKKRTSKERHTIGITGENQQKVNTGSSPSSKTPDALQSSPFRRQTQVNRKYRDHSLSNCKINEIGQKTTDLLQDSSKEDEPKITRNTNRIVSDKEPRSRDRTHYYKQADKPQQIRGRLLTKCDIKEASKDEYQRSSSQSRVQTMIQEIERKSRQNNEFQCKTAFTPPQKEDIIKDFDIGKRITRNNNVITKKQNRNKNNVTGPVRPIHDMTSVSNSKLTNGRGLSNVQRSNTVELTLKKEFDKTKDHDIMFI